MSQTMIKKQLNKIKDLAKQAKSEISDVNLDETVVELTTREMQVLQYICKEYRNTEIASELFLSVRTVEGHRNNLLIKTGCKSTAGLALFAVKHKLYKLDV